MNSNENSNLVEVRNLDKWFGDLQALNDVSMTVEQGKVMVIIGPSGSGKSTLLRCINFLEVPTDGEVWFMGEKMTEEQKSLNHHRAEIGMVFQSFNLYAHLTILENITLAQRVVKKTDKKLAEEIAMEQLRKVGIADKADKLPSQISGGMRKRVGLARALAMRPRFILFDEPTTGLDPVMSNAISKLIRQVHDRTCATSLVISHDIEGAYSIADNMAMIYRGGIVFEGTPDDFRGAGDPLVQQFVKGLVEGPINPINPVNSG